MKMKNDIATNGQRSYGGFSSARRGAAALLLCSAIALVLVAVGSSARSAACSFCGKNLVKNPGAESGKGQNAVNESGAVPGWTKTTGAFGAASYTAAGLNFSATGMGPKDKGKNYFFGGDIPGAQFPDSVGTQTIKLPAGAAGHKATLSGWLGNYSNDTAQVRAEFMDGSGKMISALRIGPDTTISTSGDMAFRTRSATVPSGAASIAVVITFTDHNNANEAGADDISVVLS
jgi:hypothetical protein